MEGSRRLYVRERVLYRDRAINGGRGNIEKLVYILFIWNFFVL